MMSIEPALTAQFAAFTALYMADSNATTRGWTPAWYGRYRFILTAIVGIAIFVSLVGRAKIGSAAPRLGQGLEDRMHVDMADTKTNWARLEAEEKEKNREKKRKEKEAEEKKAQQQQEKENSKSQDPKEEKKKGKDEEKKKGKDEEKNKDSEKEKDEGGGEEKKQSKDEGGKEDKK